jgi:hypothetical protein
MAEYLRLNLTIALSWGAKRQTKFKGQSPADAQTRLLDVTSSVDALSEIRELEQPHLKPPLSPLRHNKS